MAGLETRVTAQVGEEVRCLPRQEILHFSKMTMSLYVPFGDIVGVHGGAVDVGLVGVAWERIAECGVRMVLS